MLKLLWLTKIVLYEIINYMKQIFDLNKSSNQLTEQGNLSIEVYVQDKMTGEIIGLRRIKRSELARMYHEQKVVSAKNGKCVIEV